MTLGGQRCQGAVVLIGASLVVAFALSRASHSAAMLLYETNSILAVIVVLAGARWSVHSCDRRGWRFFAAGVATYAAGDLLWCLSEVTGLPGDWSDPFYLASYPFFVVALITFAKGHRDASETTLRQLIDAAIVFVGALGALWVFTLGPALEGAGEPVLQRVLTAVYTALDVMLLALVIRLALSTARWPAALRILAFSFAGLFAADLVWRLQLAEGTYQVTSYTTAAFMLVYVLWAVAVLDPSLRAEFRDRPRVTARVLPYWQRLALLGLVSLAPALLVTLEDGRIDTGADRVVIVGALVVLPLLILARAGELLLSLSRTTGDLDLIIDSAPIPVAVTDRDGRVLLWNNAAERVTGYQASDVVGAAAPVVAAADDERVAMLYHEALRGTQLERVEATLLHRDGHPVDLRISTAPLHRGDGRVVALFEDITEQRLHRDELMHLARHDTLTGLPNRDAFVDEMEARTETWPPTALHVVLLDIDNFKSLNETAGLATGDEILRELSELLRSCVRDGDVVARLSGDEFALLLAEEPGTDPSPIVHRLLDAARDHRHTTAEGPLDVTLSAGLYTLASRDSADLALRRADEALYCAKTSGKNRLERWLPDSSPSIHVARTWSPYLKDALREERIALHVQPVVRLDDGRVAFFEALARLVTPEGDLLAAGMWIDHAEELGLMPAIDAAMLSRAAAIIAEHPEARLLLNVSASSFHDQHVLATLERTLRAVPCQSLGIEITEHAALRDIDRAPLTLEGLRALGALVAIDDFGAGFTSFRELASLPCDLVKIPGAPPGSGAPDRRDALVIAGAISDVAHHYGRAVVMEGLETAEEAEEARALGIEYGQGWHFGRPAPPSEIMSSAATGAAAGAVRPVSSL